MQCNSCNASFDVDTDRNDHYRSDWHRYNLKRKVAGLPGVTEQWFKARCDAIAASAAPSSSANNADRRTNGGESSARLSARLPAVPSDDESPSAPSYCCTACSKRYSGQSALDNHMRSKLHAARVASIESAGGAAAPAGGGDAGIVVTSGADAAVTTAHSGTGQGMKKKRMTAGAASTTATQVSHDAAKRMIERAAVLQARDRNEKKEGNSDDKESKALKTLRSGSKDVMASVKEREGEGEGAGENGEEEDEGEWEEVDDEEEIAALTEKESQVVPDSKDQTPTEDKASDNQAVEEKAVTSQGDNQSNNQGDSQSGNQLDGLGGSTDAEKTAGRETSGSEAEESGVTECATSEGETIEGGDEGDEDGLGWDPSCCLFCEKAHEGSVSECVEHMHRHHGFFLPDAEYVADLAGLLQYLAGKIVLGRMCLYCDDRGKQFSSVEAVRGHMEAKSHAKLRYGDGSGEMEAELEEFYDFSSSYEEAGVPYSTDLVLADESRRPHVTLTSGGMELIIHRPAGGGDQSSARSSVIGCREWARYYKQRPRPSVESNSRELAAVVSRYRAMGLATTQAEWRAVQRERRGRDGTVKAQLRFEAMRTKVGIANDKIYNLPKNVVH